jgi:hypothetical protein
MKRMERNLRPKEWKIAQKLLGWLVCAKRPLRWHEIQVAYTLNPEDLTIELDDRKLRIHIRDMCGSLVQAFPGDRLELVHTTAKT